MVGRVTSTNWATLQSWSNIGHSTNTMLLKEVSCALEELSAIIARLQFVTAELHKAKQLETKRQRKQAPRDEGK
jgi:hypothetical protein